MSLEEEVSTFLTNALVLTKANNHDEIMKLYVDDASYLSVGIPPLNGKQEILENVYKPDEPAELKGHDPKFTAKCTREEGGLIFQNGTYTLGPLSGNYVLVLKRMGGDLKYMMEVYTIEMAE